jgi:glycosyltransferase involved in cell wall biosynthesis
MKKHLLIVINSLDLGGAENYAVQLANRVSLIENFDVSIAFGITENLFLLKKLSPNVNKIYLPNSKLRFLDFLLQFIYLLLILYKFKVTIVQSLLPRTSVPAIISGKIMSKKLFYTPMFADNILIKSRSFAFFNFILRRTDANIIALSDFIAGQNVKFGLKRSKIFVIPLGIDTDKFNSGYIKKTSDYPSSITIGIVSRFEDVKDVASGIKIFKNLLSRSTLPAKLLIVGDGVLRPDLERLVISLDISDHVSFLGKMANTEEIYRSFDVYLQVTKGPNLGLSALEALSSGVPLAIYTRNQEEVKMAEDTLSNVECGVILPTDFLQAAKVMLDFLESERLLVAKINARQLAVNKYSLDRHIKTLMDYYE